MTTVQTLSCQGCGRLGAAVNWAHDEPTDPASAVRVRAHSLSFLHEIQCAGLASGPSIMARILIRNARPRQRARVLPASLFFFLPRLSQRMCLEWQHGHPAALSPTAPRDESVARKRGVSFLDAVGWARCSSSTHYITRVSCSAGLLYAASSPGRRCVSDRADMRCEKA